MVRVWGYAPRFLRSLPQVLRQKFPHHLVEQRGVFPVGGVACAAEGFDFRSGERGGCQANDVGRKNPVVLATDEQGGDVVAFQPFRAVGVGGIAEKFGVGRRLRANHGLKFSPGAKIGDSIGSMKYQIQNRDNRGWRSRPLWSLQLRLGNPGT